LAGIEAYASPASLASILRAHNLSSDGSGVSDEELGRDATAQVFRPPKKPLQEYLTDSSSDDDDDAAALPAFAAHAGPAKTEPSGKQMPPGKPKPPKKKLVPQSNAPFVLVSLDEEVRHPNRLFGGIVELAGTADVVSIVRGKMVLQPAASQPPKREFSSYIRPPKNCPENKVCSAIHKIPEATVQNAPEYKDVWRGFLGFVAAAVKHGKQYAGVERVVLVAHNGALSVCLFCLNPLTRRSTA
jgi:hypothetical protein